MRRATFPSRLIKHHKDNRIAMNGRLNEILEEIKELEKNVQLEMKRREEELRYKVREGRVIFAREILKIHKRIATSSLFYLLKAPLLTILSTPVIYSMLVPAVLMDMGLWIYQAVCFPIYRISKVRRSNHIVFDRHYLKYLNVIERLNCDYCSYVNGILSYATEVGARTEQYWCPIKHAYGKAQRHSRAHQFTDYGDADAYRSKLEELREKLRNAESE